MTMSEKTCIPQIPTIIVDSSASCFATRDHWTAHTKATKFWTVLLTVTYPRPPVNFGRLLRALCLWAPPASTNDWYERRWPSFEGICASTVTCSREPDTFTRLLYAPSLSVCAQPDVVPVGQYILLGREK
jgi:hypothetical protein